MAKGKADTATPSTALVAPDEAKAALAAALDFDYGADDGLQEVDGEDIRLPVLVWNMKSKDEKGQARRVDQFYDTVNEKVLEAPLKGVFIHLHKSRTFTTFDDASQSNKVICSSSENGPSARGTLRVTHPELNLSEGTERTCETCVDRNWFTDGKGKKRRNCDPVYGVFFVALADDGAIGDGFLLRFKRTSLPAFKKHLQQHHIGKHPAKRGANVPLYAFAVNVSLETSENGNYAVPVIERGNPLPRALCQQLAEQAKYFGELGSEMSRAAEKQEAKAAGDDLGGDGGGGTRGSDFADD